MDASEFILDVPVHLCVWGDISNGR